MKAGTEVVSGIGKEEGRTYESEREVAQSYLTLCDPMDCSLPGSSVHGIFQTIVLEWIAISFLSRSSRPRDGTQVSRIVYKYLQKGESVGGMQGTSMSMMLTCLIPGTSQTSLWRCVKQLETKDRSLDSQRGLQRQA